MIEHSITDEGMAYRWKNIDWTDIEARVADMGRELREASLDGDWERLEELSERFLGSYEARRLTVRRVADADRGRIEYRDGDLFLFAGIFDAGRGSVTYGGAGEGCQSEFCDRAEKELHLMLQDAVSGRPV